MNETRIIERIKKMLALANDLSATEGERDNALRMAYATMAKYNIDEAALDASQKHDARINFESQSFSWRWARQVNMIIGRLFFCKYYSGRNINGTQCMHHFIGKESNAMTAAVMADWIVKSILKEARGIYKQNTSPGARSFALGAMEILSTRVDEIITKAEAANAGEPGTGLALINIRKAETEANEAFVNDSGVKLKTGVRRSSNIKTSAYNAGKEYGHSINLSPQLGGSVQGKLK